MYWLHTAFPPEWHRKQLPERGRRLQVGSDSSDYSVAVPKQGIRRNSGNLQGYRNGRSEQMGQMREDVIIHTKGKFNTYAMTVDEPRIHTVDEVMAFAKEVFEGKDEGRYTNGYKEST